MLFFALQETKLIDYRQLDIVIIGLETSNWPLLDTFVAFNQDHQLSLSLKKTRLAMETNQVELFEEYQSEDIMSLNHSRIINRISVAMSRYDDTYDVFPELELELTTGKCKPDVSIYQNLPADWFNDIMFYNQAPIVAVEVLSPKQAVTDLTDKALKQYFPAGVQVVWIVVPTLRIVQTLLPDGSMQTWSSGIMRDPVTGMEMDLGYLFK